MEELTDGALWRQAAAGSTPSFGALFDRHARAVYNYCFRRVGDWALAEDLMSIVFLEAWRKRRGLVLSGESVLPWLLGVATNVVRNQRRALRRFDAALTRLPKGDYQHDFADEIVDRLDDERRMQAILRAVRRLPQRQQEVLALCAWSGLTYEEAAIALNVPIGTVRSRLSRARKGVRAILLSNGHQLNEAPGGVASRSEV